MSQTIMGCIGSTLAGKTLIMNDTHSALHVYSLQDFFFTKEHIGFITSAFSLSMFNIYCSFFAHLVPNLNTVSPMQGFRASSVQACLWIFI